jgi:hypothetical protein
VATPQPRVQATDAGSAGPPADADNNGPPADADGAEPAPDAGNAGPADFVPGFGPREHASTAAKSRLRKAWRQRSATAGKAR